MWRAERPSGPRPRTHAHIPALARASNTRGASLHLNRDPDGMVATSLYVIDAHDCARSRREAAPCPLTLRHGALAPAPAVVSLPALPSPSPTASTNPAPSGHPSLTQPHPETRPSKPTRHPRTTPTDRREGNARP